MRKVVTYAILTISPNAVDQWGVVETFDVALADYKQHTGKPGNITREATTALGHRVVFLDESDRWSGSISEYHVAPVEWVEED